MEGAAKGYFLGQEIPKQTSFGLQDALWKTTPGFLRRRQIEFWHLAGGAVATHGRSTTTIINRPRADISSSPFDELNEAAILYTSGYLAPVSKFGDGCQVTFFCGSRIEFSRLSFLDKVYPLYDDSVLNLTLAQVNR